MRIAYADAYHIVNEWLRVPFQHGALHDRWDARLTSIGVTHQHVPFGDAPLRAVTYPEIIALTGMLASPYWVAMAAAATDNAIKQFYAEVARRLGVPGFGFADRADPLIRWCYDHAHDYFSNVSSRVLLGDRYPF